MRKIAVYGIIIFQIALIGSLIRGIQTSQKSKERLAELEKRKGELVEQNAKLAEEKRYVESDYYLEKVAREELHLVKPGETVVILPENKDLPEGKPEEGQNTRNKPYWEQWLTVLVK